MTSPGTLAHPALPTEALKIVDLIREKDNFLIVGHIRPDGDCLGSCLGLWEVLAALGKSARFYTAGPNPEFLCYLPRFDAIENEFPDEPEKFGAILSVDTADANRVFPGYEPSDNIAVIDHHISNTHYGALNWVDGKATAAAEMIYFLAGALGVKITPAIATCLYTGIMTDTGGFRYSNTTQTTFRVTSDLVACGANPSQIAEAVWDSRPPVAVKIGALILSTLNYEFDGRFVWNEITQQMLQAAGGTEAEAEGLSSEMRSIRGVDISVLFYETPEGTCRIGFRSRGDLNVSTLASLMGGGGHRNASGATINEDYLAARKHALETVRDFLTKHFAGTPA